MATVSDRTAAGQGWGGWAGAWVCTAGRGGTLLPGCAPPLHAALWCFFFFFWEGGLSPRCEVQRGCCKRGAAYPLRAALQGGQGTWRQAPGAAPGGGRTRADLGHQLAAARVGREVPYPYVAVLVPCRA